MFEPPPPLPATDASGFLPGPLGLRLDEEFLSLNAINGSRSALDAIFPVGNARINLDGWSLRVRPSAAWTSGDTPAGEFSSVEIGHGLTHLRLRGVEALHFLGRYTCVDLFAAPLRQVKTARTRLNQYDCTIWWTNTRDVHLLIARSLAQSFCDHLRILAVRNEPGDSFKHPRPTAPEAPNRRG